MEEACAEDEQGVSSAVLTQIAEYAGWATEVKPMSICLVQLLKGPAESWRRIYKALHVAEYLMQSGPMGMRNELENYSAEVRYLCDFVYSAEGYDKGEAGISHTVRTKARLVYNLMNGGVRRQEYGMASSQGVGGYTPPSLFPQQSSQPEQLQVSPMKAAPVFHRQQRAGDSPASTAPVVEDQGLFHRLNKPKTESKPAPQLFSAQQDLLSLGHPPVPNSLDLISFDSAPPSKPANLLFLEPARPSPAPLPSVSVKISHNMASAPAATPGPAQTQTPSKGGLNFEALATGLDDLKLESKPKDSKKTDFIIRI